MVAGVLASRKPHRPIGVGFPNLGLEAGESGVDGKGVGVCGYVGLRGVCGETVDRYSGARSVGSLGRLTLSDSPSGEQKCSSDMTVACLR